MPQMKATMMAGEVLMVSADIYVIYVFFFKLSSCIFCCSLIN